MRKYARFIDQALKPSLNGLDMPLILAASMPIDSIYRSVRRRSSEGRTLADVAEAARAATYEALDTVLVDIDEVIAGSVDERAGAVTFGEAGPDRHGIVAEIARPERLAGERVLAVRRDDIPGRSPVAAILRYTSAPS